MKVITCSLLERLLALEVVSQTFICSEAQIPFQVSANEGRMGFHCSQEAYSYWMTTMWGMVINALDSHSFLVFSFCTNSYLPPSIYPPSQGGPQLSLVVDLVSKDQLLHCVLQLMLHLKELLRYTVPVARFSLNKPLRYSIFICKPMDDVECQTPSHSIE